MKIATTEVVKREKKGTIFTHADMLNVKSNMGNYGRSTIGLARDLRLASNSNNRKAV